MTKAMLIRPHGKVEQDSKSGEDRKEEIDGMDDEDESNNEDQDDDKKEEEEFIYFLYSFLTIKYKNQMKNNYFESICGI